MLQHEMLTDKGVLIVRPEGPLSKNDFSALAADADAYITAHGGLNGLIICAEAFPGWDGLDGFVSHFKFVRNYHSKIRKVAIVSDSNVMELLPRIAKHFVNAELRNFKGGREVEALAWIAT